MRLPPRFSPLRGPLVGLRDSLVGRLPIGPVKRLGRHRLSKRAIVTTHFDGRNQLQTPTRLFRALAVPTGTLDAYGNAFPGSPNQGGSTTVPFGAEVDMFETRQGTAYEGTFPVRGSFTRLTWRAPDGSVHPGWTFTERLAELYGPFTGAVLPTGGTTRLGHARPAAGPDEAVDYGTVDPSARESTSFGRLEIVRDALRMGRSDKIVGSLYDAYEAQARREGIQPVALQSLYVEAGRQLNAPFTRPPLQWPSRPAVVVRGVGRCEMRRTFFGVVHDVSAVAAIASFATAGALPGAFALFNMITSDTAPSEECEDSGEPRKAILYTDQGPFELPFGTRISVLTPPTPLALARSPVEAIRAAMNSVSFVEYSSANHPTLTGWAHRGIWDDVGTKTGQTDYATLPGGPRSSPLQRPRLPGNVLPASVAPATMRARCKFASCPVATPDRRRLLGYLPPGFVVQASATAPDGSWFPRNREKPDEGGLAYVTFPGGEGWMDPNALDFEIG